MTHLPTRHAWFEPFNQKVLLPGKQNNIMEFSETCGFERRIRSHIQEHVWADRHLAGLAYPRNWAAYILDKLKQLGFNPTAFDQVA